MIVMTFLVITYLIKRRRIFFRVLVKSKMQITRLIKFGKTKNKYKKNLRTMKL